jgi:hypothetical protein
MTLTARRPLLRRNARGGFTLLETALSMVIILTGVVAIVEAHTGFVKINRWSSHEATATYLANEIRERVRTLPRHDPVTGLFMATGSGGPVVVGWGREAGETTVDDFNDVDDYDGVRFGDVPGTGVTTVFQGPIDAFGRVIPLTDDKGNVVLDSTGNPKPLSNWAQTVKVEKVSPYDYSKTRAISDTDPASGSFPGRNIDQFPLRVTVTVWYLDPLDTDAKPAAQVSWIVPASQ